MKIWDLWFETKTAHLFAEKIKAMEHFDFIEGSDVSPVEDRRDLIVQCFHDNGWERHQARLAAIELFALWPGVGRYWIPALVNDYITVLEFNADPHDTDLWRTAIALTLWHELTCGE